MCDRELCGSLSLTGHRRPAQRIVELDNSDSDNNRDNRDDSDNENSDGDSDNSDNNLDNSSLDKNVNLPVDLNEWYG